MNNQELRLIIFEELKKNENLYILQSKRENILDEIFLLKDEELLEEGMLSNIALSLGITLMSLTNVFIIFHLF